MPEFKDLLLKIAQNRPLTPRELDELGRFGTETQQRNAQIANTSGKNGTPYFPNGLVSGADITIGKSIISTTTARVKRDSTQSIDTATLTPIQWESIEYNDAVSINLSVDNTKLNILTTGIYKIFFGVVWQSTLTSNYGSVGTFRNGNAYYPYSTLPAVGGLINSAYDERLLSAGDYLQLQAKQATGGSVNILSAFFAIGKVMSS